MKLKVSNATKGQAIIAITVIYILTLLASYGITTGFVKLITMCFGWNFSFRIATGVWLIIFLINLVFKKKDKD